MLHEINVLLNTSLGDMANQFARAKGFVSDFANTGDMKVDIDIDPSKAKENIRRLESEIERLQSLLHSKQMDLNVETETSKVRISNLQADIVNLAERISNKKAELEVYPQISAERVKNLQDKINAITEKLANKKINLEVETEKGGKNIEKLQSQIAKMEKDLIRAEDSLELEIRTQKSGKNIDKINQQISSMEKSINSKQVDLNVYTEKSQNRVNLLNSDIEKIQQQLNNKNFELNLNVKKSEEDAGGLTEGLSKLNGAIFNVQRAFWAFQTVLTAGLSVKWLMDINSEMEQYRMQIEVMVKDTQRANEILAELKDFADRTPYETDEVVRAGKQLMASGITDYKKYLTTAGDWAAAAGAKLEETVRVLGRVSAGQYGEAIERMRELGISTQDLWAQGLQFSKSNEFLGTSRQLMDALDNIIKEKAGGMMETLSQSFAGLMSTFKSQIADLAMALSEPMFNGLKSRLKNMTDTFQSFKDKGGLADLKSGMQEFSDSVAASFSRVGEIIGRFFTGEVINSLGSSMKTVFVALASAIEQILTILSEAANIFFSFGIVSASTKGNVDGLVVAFELLAKAVQIMALGLATLALGLKEAGALMEWFSDVAQNGFADANKKLAENTEKNNAWYMKQYNNIMGIKDATGELEKEKNKSAMSEQERWQKEKAAAFEKQKQVQADIENDKKRADIHTRLAKAMGKDSVEIAQQEFELAQKNLQRTLEAEEQSRAVKMKQAQATLQNAKTAEERARAEKALAEVQKESLTVEEMRAEAAEKQVAYYQSLINKQQALGKFVYESKKLIAEANHIDATGGDSTVKRYEAKKQAITEYLSELDKLNQSQIAIAKNSAELGAVMSSITVDKVKSLGGSWQDIARDVSQYKDLVSVNLAQVEMKMIAVDSAERMANVNRLQDRLSVIRQMLQSESLGAQQRRQLIEEERNVFNSYTKSISDGIRDAMAKIESLQQKVIGSASSAIGILKDMGGSRGDYMKAAKMALDAYNQSSTHSLEDMQKLLGLQKQLNDVGVDFKLPFSKSDILDSLSSTYTSAMDNIKDIKDNMSLLVQDAADVGKLAAQNYFAEWQGYVEDLRGLLNGSLSVPISIDTSGIKQAIAGVKDEIANTINSLQTSLQVEMPKPQVIYNTFQQTFQVGINIQGNTMKDVDSAVTQAREAFGRELRDAFQEANAQYGF